VGLEPVRRGRIARAAFGQAVCSMKISRLRRI